MPKLKIDFSGTAEIDSDNVNFLYVGDGDDSFENIITGTDYMNLSENDRHNYVLESIADVCKNANDLMFDNIEVSTENKEYIYRIC